MTSASNPAPLCKGGCRAKRDWGIVTKLRWFLTLVTTPPSRLTPRHLPLHRGGFKKESLREFPETLL